MGIERNPVSSFWVWPLDLSGVIGVAFNRIIGFTSARVDEQIHVAISQRILRR